MFLVAVQVFLALLLVLLVLLQSPEVDGLGGFGGAQCNLSSVFSKGSPSSFIAKLTAVVATIFIINTLLLVGIGSKNVRPGATVGGADAVIGRHDGVGDVPSE